eukprot:TRINITY_DN987_c0_g1_i1.p2 TRINITY_DN987_c0_g1~~TRINITY_DN987_c0_g1_i1.p2  ORF type:complete len:229 (+),score=4.93 TRINITY_DN987_c0_g1_i1:184-870(+)
MAPTYAAARRVPPSPTPTGTLHTSRVATTAGLAHSPPSPPPPSASSHLGLAATPPPNAQPDPCPLPSAGTYTGVAVTPRLNAHPPSSQPAGPIPPCGVGHDPLHRVPQRALGLMQPHCLPLGALLLLARVPGLACVTPWRMEAASKTAAGSNRLLRQPLPSRTPPPPPLLAPRPAATSRRPAPETPVVGGGHRYRHPRHRAYPPKRWAAILATPPPTRAPRKATVAPV